MSRLKYITDTSWVILNDYNNYDGLLIEKTDGSYTIFFADSPPDEYDSKDMVLSEYGKSLFEKISKPEGISKEKANVGIYPSNVTDPFVVDETKGYFKKSESAKVVSAAGYYAIRFPSGWIRTFCPTLVTLQKVQAFEGPFDNKMEMNSVLNLAKNREA